MVGRGAATPLTLYRATGFWARLRGLHALPRLAGHTGLWLHPCHAVHTFGLAYAIDLVFLDARHDVVRTVAWVPPNRMAFCLGACSVVELPAGYCAGNADYPSAIRRALVE